MLDTNASRPSPPAIATDPARAPLPGLIELEELAWRADRRYLDIVSSTYFRDLPETAPNLTDRWEALLNGRITAAHELRVQVQQARNYGSRWPPSLTRALERSRARLHALELEERELVLVGLYQELS